MRATNKVQTWYRRALLLVLLFAAASIALPTTAWATVYGENEEIDAAYLVEGDVLVEGSKVNFPRRYNFYLNNENCGGQSANASSNNPDFGIVTDEGMRFYGYNGQSYYLVWTQPFEDPYDGFVFRDSSKSGLFNPVTSFYFTQAVGLELEGFEGYNLEKEYDGTVDAGFATDVTLTGMLEGATEVTPVAEYTNPNAGVEKFILFKLEGFDADLYYVKNEPTFSDEGVITRKPIAVSGITAKDKTYDGTEEAELDIEGATIDRAALIGGDWVRITGAEGNFETADAGDDKKVIISAIEFDNLNYEPDWLNSETELQASIYRADVTVTADDITKGYNEVDPDLTYTADGLYEGDSLEVNLEREPGTALGDYTISASGDSVQGSYNVTYVDGTFTIEKARPTADMFEITMPEDLTYDGEAKAVQVSVKDGYEGVGEATAWYFSDFSLTNIQNWVTTTPTSAGDYTVVVTVEEGEYYTAAKRLRYLSDEDWTFTIEPKPVTVSGIYAANKEYDGTTDATLNVDNAVIDGVVDGDDLKVTSAEGEFVDSEIGKDVEVELTSVTLGGRARKNYTVDLDGSAAPSADIKRIRIFAVPDDLSMVYGEEEPELTYEIIGLPEGEDEEEFREAVTSISREPGDDVGEYQITIQGKENVGDYYTMVYKLGTFTIEKARPTADMFEITMPDDLTYDGEAKAVQVSVKDGYEGVGEATAWYFTDFSLSNIQNWITSTPTDVDDYTVVITVEEGDNYKAAKRLRYLSDEDWTFSIEPKPVTVSGIVASDKEYDETTVAYFDFSEAVIDGVVEGDELEIASVEGEFEDPEIGADKNVNITSITLGGSDEKNYTVDLEGSENPLKAEIGRVYVFVVADDLSKVYGEDDPELTYQVVGMLHDEDEEAIRAGVTDIYRAEGDNAGEYEITVEGAEFEGEYNRVIYVPGTFTIEKASPTADMFEITMPEDLTYDGEAKAVQVSVKDGYEGVGEPTAAYFRDFSLTNVGSWTTTTPISVDNYTVILTVAEGDNYKAAGRLRYLSSEDWAFSIEPKPVTINVTVEDKVYDGTTDAVISDAVLEGIVESDADRVNIGDADVVATFADKNAGEDIEVILEGYKLTGRRAFNYELTQPTATATIEHKTVVVDGITAKDKPYDGTTTAELVYDDAELSPAIDGEQIALDTTVKGDFEDANVGEDKKVTFLPKLVEDAEGVYKNYKINTILSDFLSQSETQASITTTAKLIVKALDQNIAVGGAFDDSVNQVAVSAEDAEGESVDISALSVIAITYDYDERIIKRGGNSAITPSNVVIVDADGNEVMTNFDTIEYVPGTFTVSGDPITGVWERIWGNNGYATMAAIVQCDDMFKPEDTKTVVITTRANWQDPLCATALAGVFDAPLLLVGGPKDGLASATRNELQRLKPNRVIVVGNTSQIPATTINAIKTAAGTGNVSRVDGGDASTRSNNIMSKYTGWGDTAIIATQNSFKDSLSAAPFAYKQKFPIAYVGTKISSKEGGKLSSATLKVLKSKGIKKCVIVGGPLAVSNQVHTQLKNAGISYERWYGNDSLDTSATIARAVMQQYGMTVQHVSIARSDGDNYVDALAGAALTGKLNSVLVLADSTRAIGKGTKAFDAIKDEIEAGLIHGHVYGGTTAISKEYFNYFNQSK